jgi:hydroxyacylglutathione hydrolase
MALEHAASTRTPLDPPRSVSVKQVADDLFVLEGFPPYAINAYLLGDVLVDAGTRFDARRILRRLKGRHVAVHALTHVHPDHQGASHAICEALGIPLWCSEGDAVAMEVPGEMMARMRRHLLTDTIGRMWAGPPHPVARRLREGDKVGTFTVLETPGHTAGHLTFWREADGALVLGDLIAHLPSWKNRSTFREPERIFSVDPPLNRQSARRLLDLKPKLICFGHGPPLRRCGKLMDFIARLPD